MRTFPRIAMLSSHVGLGHAARDLAIARALRRLSSSTSIVWITASPARELLELEGERVHEVSYELESITPFIERFVEQGFHIALARDLIATLRRNFERIVESIDFDEFDAVFADEFWELVLCGQHLRRLTVFGTDFVLLPLSVGVPAILFNRAFVKRLSEFRRVLLLNIVEDTVKGLTAFISGIASFRRWVERHCKVVGLATSFLCDELPERESARRELGVDEDEKLVVVALGGSRARCTEFVEKVSRALEAVSRELKSVRVVYVLGPRARAVHVSRGEVRTLVRLEDMWRLYVAADLFIARAGRTTTADLECCGTPALIIPIAKHAEQKHIARSVARRRRDIFTYIDEGSSVDEIAKAIERMLARSRAQKCLEHCCGVVEAAREILEIARSGPI